METRKLAHLIELATTGSFSRAAANLHLTQSALSKSIQSLEMEIGVPLIERLGRRCTTTAAGSLVVERARRLLVDVDNLSVGVKDEAVLEGTLRVGFGAGPGACMSADFINHVLEAHPRVKLLVRRGTARFLMGALRDRSIDAVLIDARSLVLSDELAVERMGGLAGGAICRVGHPLAARAAVTMQDLLQYPVLSTDVSDEVATLTKEHYGLSGDVRHSTTVESEELEPLIAATARSDAIFFGALAAAGEQIAAGRLRRITVESQLEVSIPVALVRLASKGEPKLVQVVRDFAAHWFDARETP
ncbi:hypothetical protein APR50_20175 [Variovorax paradoxus]|jgi:DNA-binding transcriptional LysR family regulator|uniref:LysR family transcriptional regulator n=1 Tax=Variovorax paradoxus TaxID=34073 RepID=UPI0006E55AE9|nr:hypothetical protein APR52_12510 [Variovorax paradoxus]KPV05188.1 hypothetical protein APR50_20175 [Variovorax paradoxus]KPV05343.1 hypothetical protein APR49_22200 [Variovorax paradoxus]KPV20249.1 hypothetical protein APR51_17610 [Variovorax paradoxus]KPV30774.1 hypothetical protein APR48_19000 [Variovorax paradoxus]